MSGSSFQFNKHQVLTQLNDGLPKLVIIILGKVVIIRLSFETLNVIASS